MTQTPESAPREDPPPADALNALRVAKQARPGPSPAFAAPGENRPPGLEDLDEHLRSSGAPQARGACRPRVRRRSSRSRRPMSRPLPPQAPTPARPAGAASATAFASGASRSDAATWRPSGATTARFSSTAGRCGAGARCAPFASAAGSVAACLGISGTPEPRGRRYCVSHGASREAAALAGQTGPETGCRSLAHADGRRV